MTRDDIIRMAREAGLEDDDSFVLEPHTIWYFDELMLERFAALVAAAEREACARVCEAHMEMFPDFAQYCRGGIEGLTTAAAAIRARGKTK